MIENKEKPYLSIAAICEKVLNERDDVLSGIRFISRLSVSVSQTNVPEKMPVVPFEIFIFVSFKAGPARGKRRIHLYIYNPKGERSPHNPSTSAVYTEDTQSTNLITQLKLVTSDEGIYWFDVLVDDDVITRIPFEVKYIREPVQQADPQMQNED